MNSRSNSCTKFDPYDNANGSSCTKFDPYSACAEHLEALHLVCPRIKDMMQRAGDALIGFQPVLGLPNCWRMVFCAAEEVTTEDLDQMLERIDAIGEELFGEEMPAVADNS